MNLVYDGFPVVLDGMWSRGEVALTLMLTTFAIVLVFFGWQYWQARQAAKRAKAAPPHPPWPGYSESWLPMNNAKVERIEKRRRA